MKCNAAMAPVRLFFLLIVLALLTMSQASAATYSLTPGSTPISTPSNAPALCSGNQGTWSGNTYTCTWDQPFSLQQGDVITSSAAVTIHSNNGMNLTNVTLGNSSNPITLTAESGRTIQLNNSVLYSSIGGGSTQNVVLTNNTIVHGSISVSGTIQSTNSTVMGTITSSSGPVTFAGGQAFGHINVQCCKVTVSGGAVIHAGIRAGNNGIDISNSTVTGDLNAGDNQIILTNVTMLSGNISAGSNNVTINGGDITANVTNANNVYISNGAEVHGKVQARYLVEASNSTIYGDIETTDNFPEGLHHVKLTDSTVYGNVTVRGDWGTIIGNWPNSAIYGDCDYKSVTPSLCRAPPVHWKFDEAQWSNSANEVLDSSTNQRHGRARNGAVTATNNPSPASCTYGDFQRGANVPNYPFVEITNNAYFNDNDEFSVALWLKMNSFEQASGKQTIMAHGGSVSDPSGRFQLTRESDNVLRFSLRMANGNVRYVETTTASIFNGQWQHIAFSYSKNATRMRIFVNAELKDDQPNEGIGNGDPVKTPNDATGNFSIGALPTGEQGIKGQIDEVRFLNYELTAAEVATYAAETASCAVPEQCFIENFGSTTNWYPTTLNNSAAPSLQSSPSRLRLTTNAQNQSTAITFKRSFPALGNKMTIEFDYYGFGGSGADGVALVLSDATVTPSPGSYGGSLGYAQRNNGNSGFAGGWLGIGFDEFGNYQLPAEGRVGGRTGNNTNWRDSVGIRASASKSYKWLAGTNTLSPGIDTGNNTLGPGHRYRITVDSRITSPSQQVLFKLERRTSSTGSYSTLIDTLNLMAQDQSAPPANLLLSYTGSTGDNTNFHDITNIQVCTQQPSTPIEIGNPVHHIRLDYNPGLTCESNPVTVTACANATCTAPHANLAFVDLDVTYPNSPVTTMRVNLTNGVGTVSLSNTVQGNATIDVSGNTLQSCNGATPATSACSMYFSDTGLKISSIPNQVAGLDSPSKVRLQVIKTDTETKACIARLTPPTTVKFGYQCVDPQSCIGGEVFSVDGSAIASNPKSAVSQYTPLARNFDSADAWTDFTIKYTDVGKVRLHARLELPAESGQPALTLQQQSNEFVVRPHRINVTTALSSATANPANAVNPQTYGTDTGFVAAGEAFQVYVAPVNTQGDLTPNYGNEDEPESVELQFGELLHPVGGDNGELTGGSGFSKVNSGTFNEQFHSTDVSWDEVGTISLLAKVEGDDYLGTGLGAAADSTPYTVGRFYPKHFAVANSLLADTCSAFSYMDQPEIKLAYQIQAQNLAGAVTVNYDQNYSGTIAQLAFTLKNAGSGPDLSSRVEISPSPEWINGTYTLDRNNLIFSKLPNADGPYSDLRASLHLTDLLDHRQFSDTTADECGEDCSVAVLTGNLDMKFGRLKLTGGSVPEAPMSGIVQLPVQLQAEYWNGSNFVINTADSFIAPSTPSCTIVNFNQVEVTSGSNPPEVKGLLNHSLINGVSALTPDNAIYFEITPTTPNGIWPIEYDSTPAWLKYNWLKDGQRNPFSEVSVGRFRGNKRQIFWQERLN